MVMVMETPSPQTVGLQFVRQYYTILNQAPEHLHRFYNSESSFVHGGIDRPGKPATQVYGQQDIHKKILELCFRDCHAKIHLVDSQATLGNGIVVQVTGELSNNGEPMRRFMQTFVLASQQPKKYYVHNDILRYQDEVFSDDDSNDNQDTPPENDVDNERVDAIDTNNTQEQHYYDPHPINNGIAHISEPSVSSVAAVPLSTHASLPPPVPAPAQNVPLVVAAAPAVIPSSPQEPQRSLSPEPEKHDYSSQGEDDYQEKTPSKSPEPSDDQMSEPAQDEPKTYATMLSKNASAPAFGTPPGTATNTTNMMGSSKASTPSPLRNEQKNDVGFVPPQPQRPPRPKPNNHMQRGGGMGGGPVSTGNGGGGGMGYSPMQRDRIMNRGPPEDLGDNERRRNTPQYPDCQQLFVGNLPHEVDENALHGLFSEYGTVIEVRINTKTLLKMGNGGRVPNFGFIIFEEPESVQSVLRKKPIYLADHRLNVEEKIKKRDPRMNNNDMRPGSGRQSYGRGGSMMGGRGGGNRGMGGMNRGGRGGGAGGDRGGGGGSGPYNSNNRR